MLVALSPKIITTSSPGLTIGKFRRNSSSKPRSVPSLETSVSSSCERRRLASYLLLASLEFALLLSHTPYMRQVARSIKKVIIKSMMTVGQEYATFRQP